MRIQVPRRQTAAAAEILRARGFPRTEPEAALAPGGYGTGPISGAGPPEHRREL
ncbi:MAG: hypothetical protein HY321_21905 [Armatimonadetes bacterium]|nr:hypothetical protein [Armatimonadota bacterium]